MITVLWVASIVATVAAVPAVAGLDALRDRYRRRSHHARFDTTP